MHDVDILTWKMGKIDEEVDRGLNVHRIYTPPTDVLLERRLMISLAGYLRAKNYDAVHALHSIPGFFPGFRYPTVVTVHITRDIDPSNIWLHYKTLLQKIIFKKASSIICVSTNLVEILKEKYNVSDAVYIPLGIDIHHFHPKINVKGLKEHLLEGKYDNLVLSIGIHGTKIDTLLELAKRNPRTKFMVIGIPGIQQLPQNMKLLFGVSEEDLRRYYAAADLFFRPLRFATANCTILEAMAMGKPIITDGIPGVLDYLNDDSAYLARRGNYIEQFERAINDENERKNKAQIARRRAEKEFAWEIVANKVTEVYENVVK
ncbi:MAG: glycosyltransferase family 4 protein [Methanomassiliicoccales archaeon]|nr:MAG: glycosyltransferase family 4 protein [Methanomassiliicoccales archaeon]